MSKKERNKMDEIKKMFLSDDNTEKIYFSQDDLNIFNIYDTIIFLEKIGYFYEDIFESMRDEKFGNTYITYINTYDFVSILSPTAKYLARYYSDTSIGGNPLLSIIYDDYLVANTKMASEYLSNKNKDIYIALTFENILNRMNQDLGIRAYIRKEYFKV